MHGSRIIQIALDAISDEVEYLQCEILDNVVLPFPEPLGMASHRMEPSHLSIKVIYRGPSNKIIGETQEGRLDG
jgi:hypothetical protein